MHRKSPSAAEADVPAAVIPAETDAPAEAVIAEETDVRMETIIPAEMDVPVETVIPTAAGVPETMDGMAEGASVRVPSRLDFWQRKIYWMNWKKQ